MKNLKGHNMKHQYEVRFLHNGFINKVYPVASCPTAAIGLVKAFYPKIENKITATRKARA